MNQSWEKGATDRQEEKRKHGQRWIHRTGRECNKIKIDVEEAIDIVYNIIRSAAQTFPSTSRPVLVFSCSYFIT